MPDNAFYQVLVEDVPIPFRQPEEPVVPFSETVLRSYPTGSRYICNPPPMDTDNDTVYLVNGYYNWGLSLLKDGWEQCGEYQFGGQFTAFRKGVENYIVTEDEQFFERYVCATEAAKALNLLDKEDRIKLFQAVGGASTGIIGFVPNFPIGGPIPVPAPGPEQLEGGFFNAEDVVFE